MAYKGGKRSKAKLKFEKELYTPYGAKRAIEEGELTYKEIKKEYSRLRSIARKRLERLADSEWTHTEMYQQFKEGFPTLKEIGDDTRELRHELSNVQRFITSKRASVSDLVRGRKEAIETFHEHGYDFVNKQNFREFTEFMEYARKHNLNRIYDSKRIADFYESIEDNNYSQRELHRAFNEWRDNQRELEKVQNRNQKTSRDFRGALD